MTGFLHGLVIVLIVLAVIGFLVVAAVQVKASVVYIPPARHRFVIVTRKFGAFHDTGSFAATIGRHTELLSAGRIYFRPRWMYYVDTLNLVSVPVDSVGIVHARIGAPLERNQSIARAVPCDLFQDFEAFLTGGGQQGPQIEVLPSGGYYMIHPEFFKVEIVKQVTVPLRTVGLVVAKVGRIMAHGHTLAKHVECDFFQDGTQFLDGGGEQGAQPALLPGGGNYAINPEMFDVITVDNVANASLGPHNLTPADLRLVSVDVEDAGVVVVTEGPAPDDWDSPAPQVPGHDRFQKPWVFLDNGGRSGPQAEVLPGGTNYAINPLFARVVPIPTRELSLTWGAKDANEDRYDSGLEPIGITIDGFHLKVELTQTLAIPARAAPNLVKRFGEDNEEDDTGNRKPTAVKRFVGRVLGAVVKGYFNEISTQYHIENFIREKNEVRLRLADRVDEALREQGVEARLTTIGEIVHGSDEINKEFRKLADLRAEVMHLEQQYLIEGAKDKIHERELRRKKADLAATEQVLIELFGREHRAKERELDIRTRFPVPDVVVSGGAIPYAPLPIPPLVHRPVTSPDLRPGWTIEVADEIAAAPTEITETIHDDDLRKHDGDAER